MDSGRIFWLRMRPYYPRAYILTMERPIHFDDIGGPSTRCKCGKHSVQRLRKLNYLSFFARIPKPMSESMAIRASRFLSWRSGRLFIPFI